MARKSLVMVKRTLARILTFPGNMIEKGVNDIDAQKPAVVFDIRIDEPILAHQIEPVDITLAGDRDGVLHVVDGFGDLPAISVEPDVDKSRDTTPLCPAGVRFPEIPAKLFRILAILENGDIGHILRAVCILVSQTYQGLPV